MSEHDVFTATLNFRSKDLGKDSTLVLTFDDEKTIQGIFKDFCPTAYKYVYCYLLLSQRTKEIFEQSHYVRSERWINTITCSAC